MKASIIWLAWAVVLVGCTSSPVNQQAAEEDIMHLPENRTELLWNLNKDRDYTELMFTLFPEMRKGVKTRPLTSAEKKKDMAWLWEEANTPWPHETEFPVYYFLSWKLAASDKEVSRMMNARGRIRLMVDASLCKQDSPASFPWIAMVEGGVFDNMTLRQGKQWNENVDAALKWVGQSINPMTDRAWFCGKGNSVPTAMISERAHGMLEKIRQSNQERNPQ